MHHPIPCLLIATFLLGMRAATAGSDLLPDGFFDGEAVDALGLEQVRETCEKKPDAMTVCHMAVEAPVAFGIGVIRMAGASARIRRSGCQTQDLETRPVSLLTICAGALGQDGFIVELTELKLGATLSERFQTQVLRLLNQQKTLASAPRRPPGA